MMTRPWPIKRPFWHRSTSKPWRSMTQSVSYRTVRFRYPIFHSFRFPKNERLIPGNSGREALTPIGSPIVLQRRGSVYGANVPMITGEWTLSNFFLLTAMLTFNRLLCRIGERQQCAVFGPRWRWWSRYRTLPHSAICLRNCVRCQRARLPDVDGMINVLCSLTNKQI